MKICEECEGTGYRVATTNGKFKITMADQQIIRCDSCRMISSDDAAAVRFVRDLECAKPWACKLSDRLVESARQHQAEESKPWTGTSTIKSSCKVVDGQEFEDQD